MEITNILLTVLILVVLFNGNINDWRGRHRRVKLILRGIGRYARWIRRKASRKVKE